MLSTLIYVFLCFYFPGRIEGLALESACLLFVAEVALIIFNLISNAVQNDVACFPKWNVVIFPNLTEMLGDFLFESLATIRLLAVSLGFGFEFGFGAKRKANCRCRSDGGDVLVVLSVLEASTCSTAALVEVSKLNEVELVEHVGEHDALLVRAHDIVPVRVVVGVVEVLQIGFGHSVHRVPPFAVDRF